MNWQVILVGLCMALALAYLGRRSWRTLAGRSAGCDGCKCPAPQGPPAAAPLIPAEQLTARLKQRR